MPVVLPDLEYVKGHLRLDPDYTEEDELIDALIDAAIEITTARVGGMGQIEKYPATFRVAVCTLVATMYSNRETVADATRVDVPDVYNRLLFTMTNGANFV